MDRLHDVNEPGLPGTDLGASLGMFRRRSKLIIGGLILGLAAGATYTLVAPKSYSASSTVALRNISAAPFSGTDQQSGAVVDNQTEQLVASSLVVAQLAQRQLHTATPPADLLADLTVTAPAKTAILIFSYQASSARAAAQGADAFANGYLRYSTNQAAMVQSQSVRALSGRLTDLDQQVAKLEATLATAPHGSAAAGQAQALLSLQNAELNSLRNGIAAAQSVVLDPGKVVAAAVLPTSPSSPLPALGLGGGALLGLVLGLLAAALRDRSDDRLRRRGPVAEQCAPLPVLLEVAGRNGRPDPLQLPAPGSPLQEAVTEVGSRLALAGLAPGTTLIVAQLPGTSAEQNAPMLLAAGIAGAGCMTVLVLVDPSAQPAAEDLETEAELAKLIAGPAIETALRPVEGCPRLLTLELKSPATAPESLAAVLAALRSRGYAVVAALGGAERAKTQLASRGADAAVLVATAQHTTAADLQEGAENFDTAGVPLLGVVVLNRQHTAVGTRPAAVLTGEFRSGPTPPSTGSLNGRRYARLAEPLAPAEA